MINFASFVDTIKNGDCPNKPSSYMGGTVPIFLISILLIFTTSQKQVQAASGDTIWELRFADAPAASGGRGYGDVLQIIPDSNPPDSDNSYIYVVLADDRTVFDGAIQSRWHVERRRKTINPESSRYPDIELAYGPDLANSEWAWYYTNYTLFKRDPYTRWDVSTSIALDESAGYIYVGGSKEIPDGDPIMAGNNPADSATFDLPTQDNPNYGWLIKKFNLNGTDTGAEYKVDPSSHPNISDGVLAMALSGNYLYAFGVSQEELNAYDPDLGEWSGRSIFCIAKIDKSTMSAVSFQKYKIGLASTPMKTMIRPGYQLGLERAIMISDNDTSDSGHLYISVPTEDNKTYLMKINKTLITVDWVVVRNGGIPFAMTLYNNELYMGSVIYVGEAAGGNKRYNYLFQKKSADDGTTVNGQCMVYNGTAEPDTGNPPRTSIADITVDGSGIYAVGTARNDTYTIWKALAVPLTGLKPPPTLDEVAPYWTGELLPTLPYGAGSSWGDVALPCSIATDSKYVYGGGSRRFSGQMRTKLEKRDKTPYIDIGLRVWTKESLTSGKPVTIAAWPKDANNSPLRVFKTIGGESKAYSIVLVEPGDPNDSGVRIWVKESGTLKLKALRKLPTP